MQMKGPFQKISYQPNKWKRIGMIAGGSGLTPMLQVVFEALKRAPLDDNTQITLVFANVSEEDIILKDVAFASHCLCDVFFLAVIACHLITLRMHSTSKRLNVPSPATSVSFSHSLSLSLSLRLYHDLLVSFLILSKNAQYRRRALCCRQDQQPRLQGLCGLR